MYSNVCLTETYVKAIFHCMLTDTTCECFSKNLNEKLDFIHQTLDGVILIAIQSRFD